MAILVTHAKLALEYFTTMIMSKIQLHLCFYKLEMKVQSQISGL